MAGLVVLRFPGAQANSVARGACATHASPHATLCMGLSASWFGVWSIPVWCGSECAVWCVCRVVLGPAALSGSRRQQIPVRLRHALSLIWVRRRVRRKGCMREEAQRAPRAQPEVTGACHCCSAHAHTMATACIPAHIIRAGAARSCMLSSIARPAQASVRRPSLHPVHMLHSHAMLCAQPCASAAASQTACATVTCHCSRSSTGSPLGLNTVTPALKQRGRAG